MTLKINCKLKEIRKNFGYSVKHLSEILTNLNYPIKDKTIYKWEDGSITPDIKVLNLLAGIYNVNISYFFNESTSIYSLNEIETQFINEVRNNNNYKRIINLLTENDKMEV